MGDGDASSALRLTGHRPGWNSEPPSSLPCLLQAPRDGAANPGGGGWRVVDRDGAGDGCLILAVEGSCGEALTLRTLQLPPGPGQSSILPGFGGKIT